MSIKVHQITKGTIMICCDGESALKDSQTLPLWKCYRKHHWDILAVIVQIRERMTIKLLFQHVKGHQDESKSMHQLDRLAKMNIYVDVKAKDILRLEFHKEQWYPNYQLPKINQWDTVQRATNSSSNTR